MIKPIISVIIPCYNSCKTINGTLCSVLDQISIPKSRYEIIIVDDCSTDETLKTVENAVKEKAISNLRMFSLKTNKGVSFARNFGIQHSSGDWIIFLDADDKLNRESLSKIDTYSSFSNKKFDLLAFGYEVVTSTESKDYTSYTYGNQSFKGNDFLKLFLSKKVNLHMSSIAYRKDFLINSHIFFEVGKKIAEDLQFVILCLYNARSVFYSDYKLFYYQVFNSTAMNKYEYYSLEMAKSVTDLSEFFNNLISDENQSFFDFYLVNYFAYNLFIIHKSKSVSRKGLMLLINNVSILHKKAYPLNWRRYIYLRLIKMLPVKLYIKYCLWRKRDC